MLALFAVLTLAACGPEKKAPPPYKRPAVDDILRAAKEDEVATVKAKAKAASAAAAKAKADGKEVEKAPPLTTKQLAAKKKAAMKNQVASVTFALCGWAPAKREHFTGLGKTQTPQPAAGYYCDAEIVTATKNKKKRRVFMFRSEGKWQLFQVGKKFSSKLKTFAEINPAELAAYEAAEEAKSQKGKKKKKPATS